MIKSLVIWYLRGLDSCIRLIAMLVAFSALCGGVHAVAYLVDLMLGERTPTGTISVVIFLAIFPIIARLTIAAGDLTISARKSQKPVVGTPDLKLS